jgi:hypothetical protein
VRLGTRARSWEGRAIEDVEGVVARASALAQGLTGRALRVSVGGQARAEVVTFCVDMPVGADAGVRRALLEDAVRQHTIALGGVGSIEVRQAARASGRTYAVSEGLARAAS